MSFGRRLLDILFPPKCPFCGRVLQSGEELLCPDCVRDLPRTGEKTVKCDFIRAASAPFYYEGKVRDALLRYKFQGASARGAAFGRLIAEDLIRREAVDFDVITWVPLSRKRERSQGYDQTRILAESVSKTLNIPAIPLLRKIRNVPAQSLQKTPEARRANISGCYEAADPQRIQGARILLVDDIITTGATVSECARVLMLAGAEDIRAASVACHRE